MNIIKLWHILPILVILIGVQVFATIIAVPTKASDITAFGDPESMNTPFIYLGYVIVVTAIILILFKWGFKRFLTGFFLLSVWATTSFVTLITTQQFAGTNSFVDAFALLLPLIFVLLIWKYPEWYVIDIVGFVMCVGATAIIGVSFGIYPVIVLLVIFAVYDAISVYKTRHMISLAESILTQKLPALFIIPKDRNFSYLNNQTWTNLDDTAARQTYIFGMGDIIFPSAMVVSASAFLTGSKLLGIFTYPALGAMIGSYVGLITLMWYSERYSPRSHAGLPFLNAFTILGFATTYLVSLWV